MISSSEHKRIKDMVEPVFREHGVAYAVLFGSRARGDNRDDSDYDFYCVFGKNRQMRGVRAYGALYRDLCDALGGEAHVTEAPFLDKTNPLLFENMARDAVVMYDCEAQR